MRAETMEAALGETGRARLGHIGSQDDATVPERRSCFELLVH